jgi:hypothetical protein
MRPLASFGLADAGLNYTTSLQIISKFELDESKQVNFLAKKVLLV